MKFLVSITMFTLISASTFAEEYYVHSSSGLIVRSAPSRQGTKIGHLKFLSRFSVIQNGASETIDGKTGAWLQTKLGGKIGWVFGGYAGTTRPEVVSKKIPLKAFIDSNIEFGVEIANVIKGENTHGFGYLQKQFNDSDSSVTFTCDLPMSGGGDGYECVGPATIVAFPDKMQIKVSGTKCLVPSEEPNGLCKKESPRIRATCEISRTQIEKAYSEHGKIVGKVESCKR